MSYIRERTSLKTGFQERAAFNKHIHVASDFVMVYGFSKDLKARIKSFRDQGYVIHFMTGIAWGEYQDYLNGQFDGEIHWEDAQMDQEGHYIIHGTSKDIPYMVPTQEYVQYIYEKLKEVVDDGVEGIHLEEPEFWSHAGYSKSFKRAYNMFYKEAWSDPKEDHKVMYKAQMLKAELYKQAIDDIAKRIKMYALKKHHKVISVFIPTHSLINYTQWKIMSPESQLIGLHSIDGYIGQIWTGTSREPNVYQGIKKERTFETAFLEYQMMASFKSDDQRVWFLHDPIEDNPNYTWDNYQYHYEKTLVASLLSKKINEYEICPWPTRVFHRKLPEGSEQATFIPKRYDVYLNQMFHMLGDMPLSNDDASDQLKIAILLSDTAMYQRTDDDVQDLTFSDFYGLAMPLIKRGVVVDIVTIESLLHKQQFHDTFDVLVMSYDFLKPLGPAFHYVLLHLLASGKEILFVGKHDDVYYDVYDLFGFEDHPFKHLIELIQPNIQSQSFVSYGKGAFGYFNEHPASIAFQIDAEVTYINMIKEIYHRQQKEMPFKNYFYQKRGPYEIVAVMTDSVSKKPFIKKGRYAHMTTPTFEIIDEMKVDEDQIGIFYDISMCHQATIIGSTYRIESCVFDDVNVDLEISGKQDINGHIRLYLETAPNYVSEVSSYDEGSKTLLIQVQLKETSKKIKISL